MRPPITRQEDGTWDVQAGERSRSSRSESRRTQSSTGASDTFSVTVPCQGGTASARWKALAGAGGGPAFQNGSATVHAEFSATDLGTSGAITGSQDVTVTLN
jgi:hypothetical protein